MRKRTKALIASTAAAVVLGVSGFAFAAFVQNKAATAGSKAAKFGAVEITGTVVEQNLLPGDKSAVILKLKNPSGNTVKAKVESIAGGTVVVEAASVGGDNALAGGCAGFVTLNPSNAANAPLPTLAPNQTVNYELKEGLVFGDAPIECQGMEFATNWTVVLSPLK